MKTVVIRLGLSEYVKQFVNLVGKYDLPMDIRSGRYVVDAKSILGLFSLDLSRPLRLEIDDSHCEPEKMNQLVEEISPFVTGAVVEGRS